MANRAQSSSHLMGTEMQDRSRANAEVGLELPEISSFCRKSLNIKISFPPKHNEAYLEAGILLDDQDGANSDDFDPWALPKLQDFGPKWSGKIAPYLTVGCLFYLIVKIPAFNIVCTK